MQCTEGILRERPLLYRGQRKIGKLPTGFKKKDSEIQCFCGTCKSIVGLPWWLSWWRIHLPMQETWVWSSSGKLPPAVEQQSPCAPTAKLCSSTREPQLLNSVRPRACALQREKPPRREARSPQRRVAPTTPTREKATKEWAKNLTRVIPLWPHLSSLERSLNRELEDWCFISKSSIC